MWAVLVKDFTLKHVKYKVQLLPRQLCDIAKNTRISCTISNNTAYTMHYPFVQEYTTQKVSSLEDFITLQKRLSFVRKVDGLPPEDCSICSTQRIDIARSCKVSPYPCEGHECACFTNVDIKLPLTPPNTVITTNSNDPHPSPSTVQYFPACFKCIATYLYSKTNSFMRDNGRWRANCPFCKAEFCHLDLVIADAPKSQGDAKPIKKRKKSNPKNKCTN